MSKIKLVYIEGEGQQSWMEREMIANIKTGELYLIKLKEWKWNEGVTVAPLRTIPKADLHLYGKWIIPDDAETMVGQAVVMDYDPSVIEFYLFGSEQPVHIEEVKIVDGPFTIGMIEYKLDPA